MVTSVVTALAAGVRNLPAPLLPISLDFLRDSPTTVVQPRTGLIGPRRRILSRHGTRRGGCWPGAARGDPLAVGLRTGVHQDVENLHSDVRRISHDLRPAALDELGLVDSLRQRGEAVTDASDGHPLVRVVADGIPALPAAVEVAAYRIATEALTNVVRHAEASMCTVHLSADGSLHIEVNDDGRGLPAAVPRGVGLDSMAERAAELGGSCIIESAPGSGTTVRAELPLTVTP